MRCARNAAKQATNTTIATPSLTKNAAPREANISSIIAAPRQSLQRKPPSGSPDSTSATSPLAAIM
jgi:hypothetical protein